jgi:hypothetical protein
MGFELLLGWGAYEAQVGEASELAEGRLTHPRFDSVLVWGLSPWSASVGQDTSTRCR